MQHSVLPLSNVRCLEVGVDRVFQTKFEMIHLVLGSMGARFMLSLVHTHFDSHFLISTRDYSHLLNSTHIHSCWRTVISIACILYQIIQKCVLYSNVCAGFNLRKHTSKDDDKCAFREHTRARFMLPLIVPHFDPHLLILTHGYSYLLNSTHTYSCWRNVNSMACIFVSDFKEICTVLASMCRCQRTKACDEWWRHISVDAHMVNIFI
jgi:hypothetical protein